MLLDSPGFTAIFKQIDFQGNKLHSSVTVPTVTTVVEKDKNNKSMKPTTQINWSRFFFLSWILHLAGSEVKFRVTC